MIQRTTYLFLAFAFIIGMMGCNRDTDKSNVEEQNKDKFNDREREREAQFIVDVLDASYGVLEVAQLGEDKSADVVTQGKAKRIIEAQTSMIVKLKAYAESHDISIPFSGPARTRQSVKKLYNESGEEFSRAWQRELEKSADRLREKISKHKERGDTVLTSVLNESMKILAQHHEIISTGDHNN